MDRYASDLVLNEWDDTGHECAAYAVKSSTGQISTRYEASGSYTFDVTRFLKNAFLPAGYPLSVSPDYLQYQVYNVLQNFCSSLAGLIASRAVLEGHGVGNASASATDALLLTILQDIFSRVTTILSAYYLGTSLFPEAKTYRFLADIFNDAAFVVDTLSPYFVSTNAAGITVSYRGLALCVSGGLRAICAVAAGGSKAALTMHFAQPLYISVIGDIGDLSAKDGSKETVLALLGMLCGSVLVPYLHNTYATYSALTILIVAHLLINYLGVRAVTLRSLNRQRAGILWASYRYAVAGQDEKPTHVPTPQEVSAQEHIFASPSALLHPTAIRLRRVSGSCTMGVSMSTILATPSHEASRLWPLQRTSVTLPDAASVLELITIHSDDNYMLWVDSTSHAAGPHIVVVLKEGHTPIDHIRAWAHAAELAHCMTGRAQINIQDVFKAIRETRTTVEKQFSHFMDLIKQHGWTLDGAGGGLLTGSSRAIRIEGDRKTR